MNEENRSGFSEYAVTNALLAINVAWYVWMVFFHHVSPTSPGTEQLVHWGANFGPLTLDSQPWRLLSSMFVHIGIVHLLTNMCALYVLGRLAEAVYGRWTYLAAYLISGIAGSTASLLWNPRNVSAGASGAIFGIAGALIATFLVGKLSAPKQNVRYLLLTLIAFCSFDLLYGIWKPGVVDNAAHFGGFFAGAALGFVLGHHLGSERSSRMIRERVLLAATGVVLVLAVLVWKRDSYVVDAEHARVLLGKGATQEAIAQLEMTAKQHPNDSHLQSLLGEAYMRRGAFSLAEAAYRRATREKPNDPLGWAGLAQSDVAEGKFYDSASAWVQAAQLSKNGGALYWFNAGQAYAHIGKLPEAIQAFQKAVALAPNATDAWGALGFAQLKAGQNQQAATSLEKAVKLQPGNPDLRLILGNAYLAVGNQQQAQEQFFQASKLRAAMEERMKKLRPQQEPPKK